MGVSATSHKVIGNVLREVLAARRRRAVDARIIQKPGDDGVTDVRIVEAKHNADVQAAIADGTFNVAAGTAWLWAAEKSANLVDVLFVDEAGQISLANVLAMGRSARNIVLLGDPLQLEQPIQGSHPPGAERSALAHLLGDYETMPEDLGLFLPHTWRMHPNVTAFTSDAFYEGRLHSEPTLERQSLAGPRPLRGAGARVIAAEHAGGENVSPEEARLVADVAALLVTSGASWMDRFGDTRPITWDDVLIVAPYNAQVGAIQPAAAAGGTRRHRRQVPGPGGADQHLLDDEQLAGGRAARHGLPVLPPPPQRRHVTRALYRGRGGGAGPSPRSGPNAGADAPRERSLPVCGGRPRLAADLDVDRNRHRTPGRVVHRAVTPAPFRDRPQPVRVNAIRRQTDAHRRAERARMNPVVGAGDSAVIRLGIDDDLEALQRHPLLSGTHGDQGGDARGVRSAEIPAGGRSRPPAADARRHVGAQGRSVWAVHGHREAGLDPGGRGGVAIARLVWVIRQVGARATQGIADLGHASPVNASRISPSESTASVRWPCSG